MARRTVTAAEVGEICTEQQQTVQSSATVLVDVFYITGLEACKPQPTDDTVNYSTRIARLSFSELPFTNAVLM